MNAFGRDSANDQMTQGRSLPWLQEGEDDAVWDAWEVAYRDVILLDEDNRRVDTYNLSDHDIAQLEFRDELMAKFLSAAGL